MTKPDITESTGNIWADLGYKQSELFLELCKQARDFEHFRELCKEHGLRDD